MTSRKISGYENQNFMKCCRFVGLVNGTLDAVNSPHVAVVDVEGEADDAQQDAEAGEDGHGRKQLLGQEPELLDHDGPIGRRPGT